MDVSRELVDASVIAWMFSKVEEDDPPVPSPSPVPAQSPAKTPPKENTRGITLSMLQLQKENASLKRQLEAAATSIRQSAQDSARRLQIAAEKAAAGAKQEAKAEMAQREALLDDRMKDQRKEIARMKQHYKILAEKQRQQCKRELIKMRAADVAASATGAPGKELRELAEKNAALQQALDSFDDDKKGLIEIAEQSQIRSAKAWSEVGRLTVAVETVVNDAKREERASEAELFKAQLAAKQRDLDEAVQKLQQAETKADADRWARGRAEAARLAAAAELSEAWKQASAESQARSVAELQAAEALLAKSSAERERDEIKAAAEIDAEAVALLTKEKIERAQCELDEAILRESSTNEKLVWALSDVNQLSERLEEAEHGCVRLKKDAEHSEQLLKSCQEKTTSLTDELNSVRSELVTVTAEAAYTKAAREEASANQMKMEKAWEVERGRFMEMEVRLIEEKNEMQVWMKDEMDAKEGELVSQLHALQQEKDEMEKRMAGEIEAKEGELVSKVNEWQKEKDMGQRMAVEMEALQAEKDEKEKELKARQLEFEQVQSQLETERKSNHSLEESLSQERAKRVALTRRSFQAQSIASHAQQSMAEQLRRSEGKEQRLRGRLQAAREDAKMKKEFAKQFAQRLQKGELAASKAIIAPGLMCGMALSRGDDDPITGVLEKMSIRLKKDLASAIVEEEEEEEDKIVDTNDEETVVIVTETEGQSPLDAALEETLAVLMQIETSIAVSLLEEVRNKAIRGTSSGSGVADESWTEAAQAPRRKPKKIIE